LDRKEEIMAKSRYLKLGELLVREGIITQAQLEKSYYCPEARVKAAGGSPYKIGYG